MALYSILLPTYNERSNIALVLTLIDMACTTAALHYEVIVVDDGSPDGTADVVETIRTLKGFMHGNVMVIRRPGKMGLGSAYLDGLLHVNGQFVLLMDADLSHHPKYIPKMADLQKKYNYDVVTGTRYAHGGGVVGWGVRRKIMSRGANWLAQIMLNPGVSDLTGSYRLFKREVIEKVMKNVRAKGYVFQMEIIVRAKAMGYTVGEVPIQFVDRVYGESKMGGTEIVQYLKGLIQLFVYG